MSNQLNMHTSWRHIVNTILSIILLMCISLPLSAQQIKSEVIFHTELLPQDEQDYLKDIDRELSLAIDEYNWTGDAYRYELPIRIEIFFEKYSLSGPYHRYSASVLVAMRKGIQLRDGRWEFRLKKEDRLRIGDPYDPFTGLVEFYIRICLGYEGDRNSALGGQAHLEKARSVAEKARFENQYYEGWVRRREFADDMALKKSYKNIRTAAFHARAGFYYTRKGDLDAARANLAKTVQLVMKCDPKLMELHRNGHIIRFVDLKLLVSALEKTEQFDLIDALIKWIPAEE